MRKVIVVLILASTLSFAKDDKDSKPVLTPEQKSHQLLLQRNWLDKQLSAQPYDDAAASAKAAMLENMQELQKAVDSAKWTLNPDTLEFDAVPPKPEVKK